MSDHETLARQALRLMLPSVLLTRSGHYPLFVQRIVNQTGRMRTRSSETTYLGVYRSTALGFNMKCDGCVDAIVVHTLSELCAGGCSPPVWVQVKVLSGSVR